MSQSSEARAGLANSSESTKKAVSRMRTQVSASRYPTLSALVKTVSFSNVRASIVLAQYLWDIVRRSSRSQMWAESSSSLNKHDSRGLRFQKHSFIPYNLECIQVN